MGEPERKESLLAAARAVFAREGYHRATVRDIAREAGVATGTFYLYFSSKESCLLGLVEEFYQRLMGRILGARAGRGDVLAKLAASLEAVVRAFAGERDLARIVLIQAPGAHPAFDARLAQLHGDFARLIQEDLDEAVAAGLLPPQETAVTARAVVGAVHEVIVSWLREGCPADLEAALPALAAFCLRGAGGVPPAVSNSTSHGLP